MSTIIDKEYGVMSKLAVYLVLQAPSLNHSGVALSRNFAQKVFNVIYY